jgi:hypothetical protein
MIPRQAFIHKLGLDPSDRSIAARSKWVRIEALQRNQEFIEDYTTAREAWRGGAKVTFPPGTYWLRRHAHVFIAAT